MSNTALDPDGPQVELHNIVRRNGRMRTRKALVRHGFATSATLLVFGFSVESPTSTEVYHYLFERSLTTGDVTLRVVTEEMATLFTTSLGVCGRDPVITWALANNQLLVSSPSFAGCYYGLIGGGLVLAQKVESADPLNGALDIPPGHVCSWGGRFVVAVGNSILISDGRTPALTFITPNVVGFPGTVYDLLVGPDGALYVFTSADVYLLPVDALAQTEIVQSFIGTIVGVNTSGPRNACASAGAIMALSETGLVFVSRSSQRRISLAPYAGKRAISTPIEVTDYRAECRIFPTTQGAAIGLTARRVFLDVDVREDTRSYISDGDDAVTELVGTLRSRDGDTLYVFDGGVYGLAGSRDHGGTPVDAVVCLRLDAPADVSLPTSTITVGTDAIGAATEIYMGGASSARIVPTVGQDVVIGSSVWGADTFYFGREKRTVEHSATTRAADVQVEICVTATDRSFDLSDLEVRGQGRARRSK